MKDLKYLISMQKIQELINYKINESGKVLNDLDLDSKNTHDSGLNRKFKKQPKPASFVEEVKIGTEGDQQSLMKFFSKKSPKKKIKKKSENPFDSDENESVKIKDQKRKSILADSPKKSKKKQIEFKNQKEISFELNGNAFD